MTLEKQRVGSIPLRGNGAQSRLSDELPVPPEPRSIDDTRLNEGFITDLLLKTIYFGGQITANDICSSVKLPFANIVERQLTFLKREEMVSVIGTRGIGERAYVYAIAPKGIERVREALGRSQYVGPAPVTLPVWSDRVRAQGIGNNIVRPEDVRMALSELVLNPRTFRKIGPAVNSGRSMFVYGPPGNGKTTIAQSIGKHLLKGEVYIPYAIEVDGHVIRMYDPLNHQLAEQGGGGGDARWVLCQRPVVIVGGELLLQNLDLIYDPISKYYEAPFQMRASNGLFMIDDFGRQQVRPQDLLNRWIVPLETRIDFLTLHTGKKIEIPFDELIVFSTNLDPRQLVDEAFLRRIRHKIEVPDPTDSEYLTIFQRVAAARGIPFDQQVFVYLMQEWYIKPHRELKAVHPRDILDHIFDVCNYQGTKPLMTRDLIDQACDAYFVNL